MNILIFPSWYPTIKKPLSGIFIFEQAQVYAELNPQDNVIIAKWDNGYCHITPRKPLLFALGVLKSITDKEYLTKVSNNLYEMYTPAPTVWSRRFPFGGYERLYKNFKHAYLKAQENFGNIDVIHAHVCYPAGYLAAKLAEEFGCPYVLTEHMGPFPFDGLYKEGKPFVEIDQAFNKADQVIAVSNSLRKRIQSFYYPCHNVIANFIEDENFSSSSEKYDKFTFFTLAGIGDQKGIDTLIETIALLGDELNSKLSFVIGGDGNMLETYQSLAKELNVNNITWLGYVGREEAPELFRRSHVYIMLSRYETFGIVYAEAAASGLPIIATKCGGPEDIVNEVNGLLVDIDNPEQTAVAIKSIYNSYSSFCSVTIRNDFVERLGKKQVSADLKQVYEQALKNK